MKKRQSIETTLVWLVLLAGGVSLVALSVAFAYMMISGSIE